ncbi:MAG TPA: response regulator [Acidobacteria bacterium]|nr:response regulator [Acidobacteriota bacterium]
MRSSKGELSGSILVVDDNEMNRDMLSRRLARRGYTVEVAEDGARALERIEAGRYDLVLLDIMMPGLDGYQVLETVRERWAPSDLPVVMATAKSESEDVVRALKMGANDYVTKPFDFPEVLARVRTQIALKRSAEALSRANARMRKDLEAAARIQRTLLPPEARQVAGARCAWRYLPCDELAGDTLNVLPLAEGATGLFVLDVSGHGVPAALLSVTLSRSISAGDRGSSVLWTTDPESGQVRPATPIEVAEELVRRFPYDDETHQYFTMVYGVFDGRTFTFVSAGHTPVIHLSRAEGRCTFHGSTGPPIALIPASLVTPKFTQEAIVLEPGDRLYLLSDGIPEASSPEDEELGMERTGEILRDALDRSLEEGLDLLLDRLQEWTDEAGPDDDVSILGLEAGGVTP